MAEQSLATGVTRLDPHCQHVIYGVGRDRAERAAVVARSTNRCRQSVGSRRSEYGPTRWINHRP